MVLTRGAKRRAGKTLLGSLLSTDDDVRDVVLIHLQKDSFDGCMSLVTASKTMHTQPGTVRFLSDLYKLYNCDRDDPSFTWPRVAHAEMDSFVPRFKARFEGYRSESFLDAERRVDEIMSLVQPQQARPVPEKVVWNMTDMQRAVKVPGWMLREYGANPKLRMQASFADDLEKEINEILRRRATLLRIAPRS